MYICIIYIYTYVCISAEPLSPFPFLLPGAAALRLCHLDLPWQRRGPGTTGAACHGQPDGEVPWCIAVTEMGQGVSQLADGLYNIYIYIQYYRNINLINIC